VHLVALRTWIPRPTRRRAVPALVGAALLAAACGGAASPSGGAPSPAKPAPAPATPSLKPIHLADCCISGTEIGMWVAYDEKIFQRYGLDPDLKTVAPPADIVATQAGEVDLGTGPGSAIAAYASGSHDIVFVAGNVSKPVFFLVAPKDVTSVAQLKGAKVGISGVFAPPDVAMRNALARQYGLVAGRNYQVVPFKAIQDILPAVQQGLVKAGVLSSPLYLQAQKAGLHVLLPLSRTLPEANAWILANRRFAAQHPDEVLSFLKAYVEGIQLARQKPDVAVASIQKHSHDPSAEDAQTTYRDYIDQIDVNMDPEALKPYQVYTNNPKVASLDVREVLDFSFLKQLDASGFLKAHGMALHLPAGS
jgi:NitT/TauT family transport system substrate-binding protein